MFRSAKKLEDPPKSMTIQEIQVRMEIGGIMNLENLMSFLISGGFGDVCEVEEDYQQTDDYRGSKNEGKMSRRAKEKRRKIDESHGNCQDPDKSEELKQRRLLDLKLHCKISSPPKFTSVPFLLLSKKT
jgi:hypothetical protein